MQDPAIEIIAHRGYSARAPENTLAALEAALGAGADAVEFDVHTAACGTPVLFHDAMLSRTTNGVGPVRRRTLAQLKALDAGSWFSPDFAGERVPALAEALDALRGRAGRIYLEVKGFRELEDVDRMAEVVEETRTSEQVVFISLTWTALDRIRDRRPDAPIGYVVDEAGRVEEALHRAGADARALLDFRAGLVLEAPEVVRRAEEQGNGVAVWTVDEAGEAEQLARAGVRRFTTNEVESLRTWRDAR